MKIERLSWSQCASRYLQGCAPSTLLGCTAHTTSPRARELHAVYTRYEPMYRHAAHWAWLPSRKLLRRMVMETITKIVASLSALNIIDEKLEVRLVDGIIYSFQEQTTKDQVMQDRFDTVINALGVRVKPYLTQIMSAILWQLNN